MRHRRAVKTKSSEKTSEFRFQEFQQTSEYLFIHLSESIRVIQLAPNVVEKFSFLSRNPAVQADENSEIYFQFLEVDLEPVPPVLAGPVSHNQSYPTRKRIALSHSLSKDIRVSFFVVYINMHIYHITSVSHTPLLTNEDDRRQQKEPAAPLMQVRTERESTACFGQTRAVDVLVSAITVMRLEDQVVYTKCKQNKIKSSESDQWPLMRTRGSE
ncbi:Hypothetical_protein [Hexamita inflata]|uniref:Hypothetical_protein n=1 Tax=Hexamita inflata TaxID=28002 RepID=A0AA86TE68_9EUKA|nr:Hypothetical protein HINF_LOCUS3884 [Hexamita inflata]CAI9916241.1 Hypothetical protein HINF_LOCUS3886 [Hexamita inflata]